MRVVPTYVGLAVAVFVAAALIARTSFPAFATAGRVDDGATGSFRDLLHYRHLWLSVLAQFFYCGAQVSTWSAFIPYLKQYTSLSERAGGLLLTTSLVALAIGRLVSTTLMQRFRPTQLVVVYAVVNMILLVIGVAHPGLAGAIAILVTSLFMSIMFPTIFALGIKGLGRDTKLGGSVIVMAVIGGAVFPPVLGYIARATGSLALGYLVPLFAYLLIALYAVAIPRMQPAADVGVVVPSVP